jgi:hypothetical protein
MQELMNLKASSIPKELGQFESFKQVVLEKVQQWKLRVEEVKGIANFLAST